MKNIFNAIKSNRAIVIVSFIMSFLLLIGISFSKAKDFAFMWGSLQNFFSSFGLFLLFGACLSVFLILIFKYSAKLYKAHEYVFFERNPIGSFLLIAALCFLCYLPYIISAFPGSVNADSISQYEMLLGLVPFTDHHPFFMTYIMKLCWVIGDLINPGRLGIFLYVLLQTAILCTAFAKTIKVMGKLKTPLSIVITAMVFFCLFPIWGGYAQLVIKDTIFTGSMLWFFAYFVELLFFRNDFLKKPINMAGFIFFGILANLTRHNGIYVTAVVGVMCIFLIGRQCKFLRFIPLILILLVQILANRVYIPLANIEHGSVIEALPIPFQQTARYVRDHRDEITPEEREVIDSILDFDSIAEKYDYCSADPVKFTYHGQSENEKELLAEYFKTWFKMFFKHPGTYFEATISGSYYYYCPNTKGTEEIPYVYFASSYDEGQQFFVTQTEKLEPIKMALVKNSDNLRNTPIICILYRLGFYTFCLIYMAGILCQCHKKRALVLFIPSLITLFVCIASPTNGSFRYFCLLSQCFPCCGQ